VGVARKLQDSRDLSASDGKWGLRCIRVDLVGRGDFGALEIVYKRKRDKTTIIT